jgi:DNA-binding transcriptional ArsR family regulator
VSEGDAELELVRVASNKSRSGIIKLLETGPANLGTISKRTGLSRQLAAHHVGVLISAGIVEQRLAGTVKLYSLTDKGHETARRVLSPPPELSGEAKAARHNAADVIALAAAAAVMLLALLKLAVTPEAPLSWIAGGALAAVLVFVVLRMLIRPRGGARRA